ncbi:hypothetical protein [Domibacillus mangrovi]|uniref:Replication protein n=1 Tax=Domibacillus mangrovi TaxID=1714354 RepID=A0A1Q5NZ96_9BACI|nr:hypothetical protein [Domibacillus mangrovi]OKL35309.1 hypothetical protein BLL40_16305 [Domibacillus mangrovi]
MKSISIVFDKVNKEEYATFKDLASMREAVNHHIKTILESNLSPAWKNKLVRFLDYLRDISREYLGLSFRKQRTIATDFELKKPDTIGFWLKKLAELSIVRILPTKRSRGMQQTANFVQILPIQTVEHKKSGQAKEKNGELEVNINSNTKTINTNTYSDEIVQRLTSPYVKFKESVQSFIGDGHVKLINRLYGIWLAHTKHGSCNEIAALTLGIQAIKATMQATKRKEIKSITGYFNGTVQRMMQRLIKTDQAPAFKQVREEILPVWFQAKDEDMAADIDSDFEEEKRQFQESLKNRKSSNDINFLNQISAKFMDTRI